MKVVICLLILVSVTSCVTTNRYLSEENTGESASALPASFTTKNILMVHQGMSSDQVLALFGEPKSVKSAVCGGLYGETWKCTTWKYGDFPYDRAEFTFSGEYGAYKLNNFDIHRD